MVSGLAETGSERDKSLFSDLNTNYLDHGPKVFRCTRPGEHKQSSSRSTLLLVTLLSESQVSDIVGLAKRLRDASDLTVHSRFVFINRDLTKEESNQAYEKHKGRRGKSKLSIRAPSSIPKEDVIAASSSKLVDKSSPLTAVPRRLTATIYHPYARINFSHLFSTYQLQLRHLQSHCDCSADITVSDERLSAR